MSERLFTCDVCIREGHEEVGCHRPNELIQAGENVVCQGCLECGEFPELEDLPQERFVPPEDKRIQQLEVKAAALYTLAERTCGDGCHCMKENNERCALQEIANE